MLFGTAGVAAEGSSGVLRGHQYAACGLIATLGLAGCTGGGDDPPPSSTTASGGPTRSSPSSGSTTTASSPPTATVAIPAAARAHTEAGAEAFVKFFVEQSNIAWTLPKAGLLPPLSDPGCIACKGLEGTASELAAKKQRYVSEPITQIRTNAVGGGADGQQMVRLNAKQNKVKVVDSAGAEVRTDPAMDIARTVLLTWGNEQWRVFDAQ